MLTELTIKEFIHKVISNDPVPGGGSVSAFNGALATSLAAMVANLTIGRKKYAEVNEVMEDLSARFEELARQLIIDVDRDSDAYNRVFAAFKLPKETEEEKNKNGGEKKSSHPQRSDSKRNQICSRSTDGSGTYRPFHPADD